MTFAAKGRCLVCGTGSCACRPGPEVAPIDVPTEGSSMSGKLKAYDVVYNGTPARLKLTEEEAKRLGATEAGKPAKKAVSKKRVAKNKSATPEGG